MSTDTSTFSAAEALRKALDRANPTQRLLSELQKSRLDHIKAILEPFESIKRQLLERSEAQKALLEAANAPLVRQIASVQAILRKSQVQSYLEIANKASEAFGGILKAKPYWNETLLSNSTAIAKVLSDFQHSANTFEQIERSHLPLLNAFRDADQERINSLFQSFASDSLIDTESDVLKAFLDEPPTESQRSAEAEVIDKLRGVSSETALSASAKLLLFIFFSLFFSVIQKVPAVTANFLKEWKDYRENACDIAERLPSVASMAQVRKEFRKHLCGTPIELQRLTRIVKRDKVRLRLAPSMKANIIRELPINSIVRVLDSEDRTWLHVVYHDKENDIDMQGWVTRKMVEKITD